MQRRTIAPGSGLAYNLRLYSAQIPCAKRPTTIVGRNTAGETVARVFEAPSHR
jgi:hypothetical protein